MNYLPFCGYWFYGGESAAETASFYCSWGLLAYAPTPAGTATVLIIMMQLSQFLGGVVL